jgi:hypothetical protein
MIYLERITWWRNAQVNRTSKWSETKLNTSIGTVSFDHTVPPYEVSVDQSDETEQLPWTPPSSIALGYLRNSTTYLAVQVGYLLDNWIHIEHDCRLWCHKYASPTYISLIHIYMITANDDPFYLLLYVHSCKGNLGCDLFPSINTNKKT